MCRLGMWVRAVSFGMGVVHPQPLASYRTFAGNELARLARSGENVRDYFRLDKYFRQYEGYSAAALRALAANRALDQHRHFAAAGDAAAARANLILYKEDRPCSPTARSAAGWTGCGAWFGELRGPRADGNHLHAQSARQIISTECWRRFAQQTLPKDHWELLVIDNAFDRVLASEWDLSWHPQARHIREDELGLTPARLRGIAEARGDVFVFVDDDNLLHQNDPREGASDCRRPPVYRSVGRHNPRRVRDRAGRTDAAAPRLSGPARVLLALVQHSGQSISIPLWGRIMCPSSGGQRIRATSFCGSEASSLAASVNCCPPAKIMT